MNQQECFEKYKELSNKLNSLSAIVQNDFKYSLPTDRNLKEFNDRFIILQHEINNLRETTVQLCKQVIRDNFNSK